MAAPNIVTSSYMKFNAADQEDTTTNFLITAIAWLSSAETNRDIAADDDMTLESGDGVEIIKHRAESVSDHLTISFPGGIGPFKGLKAEDLDGGILWVYGKRM